MKSQRKELAPKRCQLNISNSPIKSVIEKLDQK